MASFPIKDRYREESIPFSPWKFLRPGFIPVWIGIGIIRLTSMLPFRAQLWLGRRLGRLALKLGKRPARIAAINLKLCFPEKTELERDQLLKTCFENFGISIIELGICWFWPERKVKKLVDWQGLEHLWAALDKGKGAILVTGHYAGLDIGGRFLGPIAPNQSMYKTQPNALFDSFLTHKRSKYVDHLVPRSKMRLYIKGLRKNLMTWYAPDQNFSREQNVFAPFMGIQAATLVASSRMARLSGAPLLPFFPYRHPDGTGYTMIIHPPLENFPSGDDVVDATAVNQSIEYFVREHPDQYMWTQKRFLNRPEGEERFY